MTHGIAVCLVAALGMTGQAARAAGDGRATQAGTALSWLIPVGVAGVEAWAGDRTALRQLGLTWASTVAAAEVLKHATGKTRPDGSDQLSFPSGHAARAFGAASYVNQRYGLDAAWPLYAGALMVGWTRVQARRHDWVDVAGSVAISEWMARTWTTPAGPARLGIAPSQRGWTVQFQVPL